MASGKPTIVRTGLDRAIETVFPGWAARRYSARLEISSRYEAARSTRERDLSDRAIGNEETPEHQIERTQIMREARDLFDNFSPVSGAVNAIATHCTPTGWVSSYPNERVVRTLTDYVAMRMEAEHFDLAQRHDATTIFGLSLKDGLVDGDNGWHHLRLADSQFATVQTIRGHRIGDQSQAHGYMFWHGQSERKRAYWNIGGLNVDANSGRVASYEIYRENGIFGPGSGSFVLDSVIPSERFLHYFDPAHLDSYRGVSPFHSCIAEIKDLKIIWAYQRKQLEAAASTTGVVKRDGGRAMPGDASINLDDDTGPSEAQFRQAYMRVRQSHFRYLEPGESIEQFRQENPNGRFWEFVKWLMSTAAWSLELPYSFLFDASGTSGAPLRFEVNRSSKALKRFRLNALKRTLNPWLKRTIAEAVMFGHVRLRATEYDNYLKGRWTFSKDPTADNAREGSLHIEEARVGARSWGSLAELLGEGSFAQVIDAKENEVDILLNAATRIAAKHPDYPIESILDRLQAVFPNQTAAPKPEEGPVPGGDGDKDKDAGTGDDEEPTS